MRVGEDRLTDEVVPEGALPGSTLVEQAAVEDLAEPGVAAELGEQLEVDLDADHGRHLESRSALVREALGSDANRVAERLGDRDGRPFVELEATASGHEPAPVSQRRRELLHEERDSLRAVVERRA